MGEVELGSINQSYAGLLHGGFDTVTNTQNNSD
jgi:hypothetical protein